MFAKNINTTNRNEMIAFLKNHFRYHTMNSWNNATSYANNVKLYNLNIPDNNYEKAADLLFGEYENRYVINEMVTEHFEKFTAETGFAAGFNGRSGGYIVMYDTEYDPKSNKRVVYPGRSIDQYEDFEEFENDELETRVKLVCEFDKMCDNLIQDFINLLDTSSFEYEERTVTYIARSLNTHK